MYIRIYIYIHIFIYLFIYPLFTLILFPSSSLQGTVQHHLMSTCRGPLFTLRFFPYWSYQARHPSRWQMMRKGSVNTLTSVRISFRTFLQIIGIIGHPKWYISSSLQLEAQTFCRASSFWSREFSISTKIHKIKKRRNWVSKNESKRLLHDRNIRAKTTALRGQGWMWLCHEVHIF